MEQNAFGFNIQAYKQTFGSFIGNLFYLLLSSILKQSREFFKKFCFNFPKFLCRYVNDVLLAVVNTNCNVNESLIKYFK